MNIKRIAGVGVVAVALGGARAAGIYCLATMDPTPIKLDPKVYDDYAGYYVFPNGFFVWIRRDGDRLVSSVAGHAPRELFPETETQFFMKGSAARWIFHRDDRGGVD